VELTGKLDTREFDAALREYQRETQKDWAYVANRQALNVAIKTGMRTPLANKAKIRALEEKEWWPKYVAKRINSQKGVRIKDGKTKGGKQKFRKVQGSYTRADARKVSKRIIQMRLSHVGFIRSGWLPAIKTLSALKLKAKSASLAGTRGIQNPKGDARIARPGLKPVAVIINNSKGAEKVGAKALQAGMDAAAVDMREFIRERGAETAKRFNGRK
jgi:hypothetical protein